MSHRTTSNSIAGRALPLCATSQKPKGFNRFQPIEASRGEWIRTTDPLTPSLEGGAARTACIFNPLGWIASLAARSIADDRPRAILIWPGRVIAVGILLGMLALLTVAAIARELSVSPRWVHARISAGELRAVRAIGRGYRVRREWLDAFLAGREVPAASEAARDMDGVREAPPERKGSKARRGAPVTGKPFGSLREARSALLGPRGRAS